VNLVYGIGYLISDITPSYLDANCPKSHIQNELYDSYVNINVFFTVRQIIFSFYVFNYLSAYKTTKGNLAIPAKLPFV
jgi:hypothetical protein